MSLHNPLDTGNYMKIFFFFGYSDEISLACNNSTGDGSETFGKKKF